MTLDRYRCPGCHGSNVAERATDGGEPEGEGDYYCRDCRSTIAGLFDLHYGEVVQP